MLLIASPALSPITTQFDIAPFAASIAATPIATFDIPVWRTPKAAYPTATFPRLGVPPEARVCKEFVPIAVFLSPVVSAFIESLPSAVLLVPSVIANKAFAPTPTLLASAPAAPLPA